MVAEPRPAREARRTELEELLVLLRRDLLRRDEAPGGDWVESAAFDLATGTKPGFFVPADDGGGLAFFTRRGAMAFGHLHTEPGRDAVATAGRLANALFGALPPDVATLDLGLTGLSVEDERAVVAELARRPGSRPIARTALERTLGPADAAAPAEPPVGTERRPVRDVTIDALADLDRRAFAGSVDALLVGPETADYARALGSMLAGELGRCVDEASCALLEHAPAVRLVGLLLTGERSARTGIFLDFTVDPERRRRGLGRFLLGWGLRALWALGYERARLWVSDDNAPAAALYARFGFRPIGTATIYRWDRPAAAGQPHTSR